MRTSALVEGIAGLCTACICSNGGGVRYAKDRHSVDPENLMITVQWMSNDTQMIKNKYLHIPKSKAARIG
jgi:hypothetical protein